MNQQHWDTVYTTKSFDSVSWFEPQAQMSLRFIDDLPLEANAPVIDVGGGASVLVDAWLQRGFTEVSVLDIAQPALAVAQQRLGEQARDVTWLCADVTTAALPAEHFALWHDRAVFHFLTEPAQRAAYRRNLLASLRTGGYALIATFADDGPSQCSGLPICRYSASELAAQFAELTCVRSEKYLHLTPWGAEQSFVFALFKKDGL
ncbi:MAG: class I SAM-dependent methyltransferase [Formosimonas sp.]